MGQKALIAMHEIDQPGTPKGEGRHTEIRCATVLHPRGASAPSYLGCSLRAGKGIRVLDGSEASGQGPDPSLLRADAARGERSQKETGGGSDGVRHFFWGWRAFRVGKVMTAP